MDEDDDALSEGTLDDFFEHESALRPSRDFRNGEGSDGDGNQGGPDIFSDSEEVAHWDPAIGQSGLGSAYHLASGAPITAAANSGRGGRDATALGGLGGPDVDHQLLSELDIDLTDVLGRHPDWYSDDGTGGEGDGEDNLQGLSHMSIPASAPSQTPADGYYADHGHGHLRLPDDASAYAHGGVPPALPTGFPASRQGPAPLQQHTSLDPYALSLQHSPAATSEFSHHPPAGNTWPELGRSASSSHAQAQQHLQPQPPLPSQQPQPQPHYSGAAAHPYAVDGRSASAATSAALQAAAASRPPAPWMSTLLDDSMTHMSPEEQRARQPSQADALRQALDSAAAASRMLPRYESGRAGQQATSDDGTSTHHMLSALKDALNRSFESQQPAAHQPQRVFGAYPAATSSPRGASGIQTATTTATQQPKLSQPEGPVLFHLPHSSGVSGGENARRLPAAHPEALQGLAHAPRHAPSLESQQQKYAEQHAGQPPMLPSVYQAQQQRALQQQQQRALQQQQRALQQQQQWAPQPQQQSAPQPPTLPPPVHQTQQQWVSQQQQQRASQQQQQWAAQQQQQWAAQQQQQWAAQPQQQWAAQPQQQQAASYAGTEAGPAFPEARCRSTMGPQAGPEPTLSATASQHGSSTRAPDASAKLIAHLMALRRSAAQCSGGNSAQAPAMRPSPIDWPGELSAIQRQLEHRGGTSASSGSGQPSYTDQRPQGGNSVTQAALRQMVADTISMATQPASANEEGASGTSPFQLPSRKGSFSVPPDLGCTGSQDLGHTDIPRMWSTEAVAAGYRHQSRASLTLSRLSLGSSTASHSDHSTGPAATGEEWHGPMEQGGAQGDVGLAPQEVFVSPYSQPSPAFPVFDDSSSPSSDIPNNFFPPGPMPQQTLGEEGALHTSTVVAAAGSANSGSAKPRSGRRSSGRFKTESPEHRAKRLAAARRRRDAQKEGGARTIERHLASCEHHRDLNEQFMALKRTVQDLRSTILRQRGPRSSLYSDPPRPADEGGQEDGGGAAAAASNVAAATEEPKAEDDFDFGL